MAGVGGGAAAWKITGEDRAKHDSQFFQLKPVNGFITGDQARGFFMQSGLPTPVLGQIWTLADMNNDGKMDKKEFSIAMHLIKKKLQGYELPKSLPASLKADPSPMMGSFGGMPSGNISIGPTTGSMGMASMPVIGTMAPTAMVASPMTMPVMSNGVQAGYSMMGAPAGVMDGKPRSGSFNAPQMPVQGQTGGYAIPHSSKLKYTQLFNTHDRNKRGFLTGVEARSLLMQSGLPQPMLAQVWTLSDVDKDGKLTCDEFCIAMHLIDIARMGMPLPQTLPPELLPTVSKGRSGSFEPQHPTVHPPATGQQKDSFSDLLGSMGMPTNVPKPEVANGESKQEAEDDASAVTFEDRRKENFAKGQAELERRRQMLQDQMKREQEARMEKERQEQEKRERIRQEQERKRQMELERQMEKQRQIEREREEQRQKMMEQREAARREMDRQRQMEWERQRKEQLLAEKRREYEQLGAIKSRSSDLKCELESQEGKRTEITQKISQVRNGVTDFTSNIEGMRTTRDTKMSEIDRLQNELQMLTMNYSAVQREREQLNLKMQTTIQNNPLSETHRTVLHSVELKKTSIQKLKKDLEQIERDTEAKLLEIDNNNTEISELNKKLTDIQTELTTLQKQQQQKQTDAIQCKRKQEEENLNKQKQEKERQEKLRKDLESQRLKEQEKNKKAPEPVKASEKNQGWFDFGNDNKTPNTAAQDDVWSSAFSAENLKTESNDIWSSAFPSQKTESPAVVNSVSSGKIKYKALYQFDARNQDELTLMPNDDVWVYEDQSGAEPGWMKGEQNGKSGWFPKDYVEKVPENQSSQQSAMTAFSGTDPAQPVTLVSSDSANVSEVTKSEESSFSSISRQVLSSPTPGQGTTAPDGLQAQALYPWKAKKENHLTFNKGDIIIVKEQQDMWWSGELNGQVGWFPKSYVKLKGNVSASVGSSRSETPVLGVTEQQSDGSARSTPQLQQPAVDKDASGELYVAMYTYKSAEVGDLNFNQGEEIMVTKMDGDWWTGTSADKSGIFPASYVKKAEVQKSKAGVGLDVGVVGQGNATPTQELTTADSNNAVLVTNTANVLPTSKDLSLNLTESLPPAANDSLFPPASQVNNKTYSSSDFSFDPFSSESGLGTTKENDDTATISFNTTTDSKFSSFSDFGTFTDIFSDSSIPNKADMNTVSEMGPQDFSFDPFSDNSDFGVITDTAFTSFAKESTQVNSVVHNSSEDSTFNPFQDDEYGVITEEETDSRLEDTFNSDVSVDNNTLLTPPAAFSSPNSSLGDMFGVTGDVFGDPFQDSDPFAGVTEADNEFEGQGRKPGKQHHVTWASNLTTVLGSQGHQEEIMLTDDTSLSPVASPSEVIKSFQNISPQGTAKQQSFNASTSTTDLSAPPDSKELFSLVDDIYEDIQAPTTKLPSEKSTEVVGPALDESVEPESEYEALDSEWVTEIKEKLAGENPHSGTSLLPPTASVKSNVAPDVVSEDFKPPVPAPRKKHAIKNTKKVEEVVQSVTDEEGLYESYEEVFSKPVSAKETHRSMAASGTAIKADKSSENAFDSMTNPSTVVDDFKDVTPVQEYSNVPDGPVSAVSGGPVSAVSGGSASAVKADKSFFEDAFQDMTPAQEYSNASSRPASAVSGGPASAVSGGPASAVKADKSFFEDAFQDMTPAQEYSNVSSRPASAVKADKSFFEDALKDVTPAQEYSNVPSGPGSAIKADKSFFEDAFKDMSPAEDQSSVPTENSDAMPTNFYDDFEIGPVSEDKGLSVDQGSATATPDEFHDKFEIGSPSEDKKSSDQGSLNVATPGSFYDDFEIGPLTEDKNLTDQGQSVTENPAESYDDFEIGPASEDKIMLSLAEPSLTAPSEGYDEFEIGPELATAGESTVNMTREVSVESDDFEVGPGELQIREYVQVLQDPPEDAYEEYNTNSAAQESGSEVGMSHPDLIFGSYEEPVKKTSSSKNTKKTVVIDDDSEYEEVSSKKSVNKEETDEKSKKKEKNTKEKDVKKTKDAKKKETKEPQALGQNLKKAKSEKTTVESKENKKRNSKENINVTKEDKKKKIAKEGKETKKSGIISGMFSAFRSPNKQQAAAVTTETSPADGQKQDDDSKVDDGNVVEETGVEDGMEPTQKSSSLKKPEIASVIAAYTATGQGQLSLQPGQLIQVRKKSASGWWEGELQARGQKRKIGWFPANYVKLLGSSSTRSTPDTGLQSQQRASPASMINRTNTPTIPPPQLNASPQPSKYIDQVVALFPYTAQNDDELTFHNGSVINVISKDDANWWQGEVNGHTGMFPSNYVGPLTTSPPQEPTWSSDPSVLAKTSAQESKRQNYIHELINTENTYMEDMSIVLDAFYRPMSEAKVMTEEELAAIFVNWNELILCNTKLSKSLKVRKKMCGKGQVINVIGDILCENLPHMTPYIRFCSCQLNAAAMIQHKTETSQEFKDVQKKCVQDSRTKGMPLSSFLLKPMQRITKYPLMIEKIIHYTPEGHPDRQNLTDALSKAEELCSQVNEGVRERENCDRLEWLQSHVQCEGLPEKLTFNSVTNCLGPRKLLFSGTLYKTKSNKELVGFLFNDFLLLTQPLSSSTSVFVFDPKAKAQYKMYKTPIFLNEVMVKKTGDEESDLCQFQLSHVDRVYNLRATNQTEGATWVKHIEAASRYFLETERKKRERAHSSETKSQGVGRLLVILTEGINLAPTEDVRRTAGVGRLLVMIMEGCDLQPSDINGKSDPFCEVSMGVQEHKTKVITATLNPKWNQSMQFIIRDVEQDVLCITVFDRDVFSPNDFLGRTEVRVKEILEENQKSKGPIVKRLLLHEVSSGEVLVKLDLQLYDNT